MVYIISVNSAAFYFTHKSLNCSHTRQPTTNIRNHTIINQTSTAFSRSFRGILNPIRRDQNIGFVTTGVESVHIAQVRSHFNPSDLDISGIHECGHHQICGVAGAIGAAALAPGGSLGSAIGKKAGNDYEKWVR
jgi:hypothetical protein